MASGINIFCEAFALMNASIGQFSRIFFFCRKILKSKPLNRLFLHVLSFPKDNEGMSWAVEVRCATFTTKLYIRIFRTEAWGGGGGGLEFSVQLLGGGEGGSG